MKIDRDLPECLGCGEPITENDTKVHFEDKGGYFHFGCEFEEVYTEAETDIGIRGSGR